MVVARLCPSLGKLFIVDESGFLQTKDDRLRNIIFNAPGFKMSEKLALTFRTSHQRI
jgi:hypothetical protein